MVKVADNKDLIVMLTDCWRLSRAFLVDINNMAYDGKSTDGPTLTTL
jgi:hypothetical protein